MVSYKNKEEKRQIKIIWMDAIRRFMGKMGLSKRIEETGNAMDRW